MKSFEVDILTPDKVVAKGLSAKSISVSTTKGEINILENHTHFITRLFTGLLCISSNDGVKYFSVENGICKILRDKITILSSSSYTKDQVDVDQSNEEIDQINQKLTKTDLMSDESIEELYNRLELLNSHLKLASK